ncbi:unnamed protein product [Prunus armeniaca]|uniref:WAT1-related protein n=1 Tax=Prunus armeniaca TaxID=36596 RepID=A0A6J5TUZ3_PRUAR|nr:unnamed protein product [Prunus armeniaca]
MGCKEGRATVGCSFSASLACDGCTCRVFVSANVSMQGGLMIVSGLYAVLWGKSKELLKMTQLESQTSLKYESNSQPVLVVTSIGGDVNSEKEMVESRKEDVKP